MLRTASSVSAEDWRAVSRGRYYFGHQSVGDNILRGLADLQASHPEAVLAIEAVSVPGVFQRPVFAHGRLGRNGDPAEKIRAFARLVDAELAGRADTVFFKLCFLDIVPGTDVDSLFAQYRLELAALRQRHPGLTIVHMTAPLTAQQRGPKAWLKRALGRPVEGYADNAARQRFNQALRREYAGREPLFDLAASEATLPDGRMTEVSWRGETFPALAAPYTSDGAHLNRLGQAVVAARLVRFLAELQP